MRKWIRMQRVNGYLPRLSQPAAACQPGCEEMEGERKNFISYFSFFVAKHKKLSLFVRKNVEICHFCYKMLKYVIFVANVAKILTYTQWENNSGSKQVARKPVKWCQPARFQYFSDTSLWVHGWNNRKLYWCRWKLGWKHWKGNDPPPPVENCSVQVLTQQKKHAAVSLDLSRVFKKHCQRYNRPRVLSP